MASVPVDETTAVVRVDQVLRAPEALAGLAGHAITVKLTERKRVQPGQQAIFMTTGWLVGDGVAVRSLGHTDLARAVAGRSPESTRDPVAAKAARDLEQHLGDADLVVTGRVTEVRLPAGSARRSTSGNAAPPISEHAPAWREAVIQVHDVRKGAAPGKQIVVRFPASTDVRWAAVPKLQTGQEGLFLLHAVDVSGGRTVHYEARHRDDFRPLDPHGLPAKAARLRKPAR